MALTKLGKTLILVILVITIVATAMTIVVSCKEAKVAKYAALVYWGDLFNVLTEEYPDLSDQQRALLLKKESDQLIASIDSSTNEGIKLYKILFAYSWRAGAAAITGVKDADSAAIDAALVGVTLPEYHLDRW